MYIKIYIYRERERERYRYVYGAIGAGGVVRSFAPRERPAARLGLAGVESHGYPKDLIGLFLVVRPI